jgi:hypothetical protein
VTAVKRSGGTHIKERIIDYMREHRGDPISANQISEALGLTRQQVFNGMSYIIETTYPLVQKVASGVYTMMDAEADRKGKLVFEVISETDGAKLLRNLDDGKLYKLSEFVL